MWAKTKVFIILVSVVIKYINKKNIGLIKEKKYTFEQEDFFFYHICSCSTVLQKL